MRVAVTGGKGGVGKTTVAAHAHRLLGWTTVDLDVTTPNLHLYLDCEEEVRSRVCLIGPEVDPDRCTLCGECARVCHSGAVIVGRSWDLDPSLCHGCGLCLDVCPRGALAPREIEIGEVRGYRVRETGSRLLSGRLNVGDRRSRHLVHHLLDRTEDETRLLLDTPAGAGKEVYDVLRTVDAALVVTQPTPAAYLDLRRLLRVIRAAGVPFVVLINQADLSERWTGKVERGVDAPTLRAPRVDGPLESDELRDAVREALERLREEAG
ncbi:MAG: 4Fe-4S binding protein [Euryarchaeota archaeon]